MDAKDLKSELEALQRLYKLLKSDGDGVSKTASDILDGNARLVLKNLLYEATQKALKAHAELIAARLEWPSSVSSSRILQPKDASKERPVPQQNIATVSDDSESFVTASDASESFGTEQSIIQNVDTSSPEYTKKRCRLCKKSSIKKLESINSQNEREPGSVTDIGGIYDRGDGIPNKPKETYCLSKEASEAIKEIELCISALQLGVDHQYLFEKRSCQHKAAATGTNSDNPCLQTQPGALVHVESSQINVPRDQGTQEVISEEICFPYDVLSSVNLAQHINGTLHLTTQQFTRKTGQTLGSSMPDELKESIGEQLIQKVDQNRGQKVKAIIDRIESGKWKTNYYTSGKRETPNAQYLVSAPSEMESPDKSLTIAMNNKRSGHVIFPQHMHSNSSEKKLMISNGNVPDRRARGTKRSPSSRGITVLNKNRKYESESTASCSSYSSISNSQQNSSDSEEYSLPRKTLKLRYVTPSISTDSVASPSSSETESKYGRSTSNSDGDEVYSSASYGSREVTSSTGSKTEGYSTEESSIPSRNYKPAKGTNRTKKQSGTLKRLKDKLAIVFHFHHHHDSNKENDHYKGKSFLSRKKAEVYGEKAVEKMRKSVVQEKKQQNHFHGIMEAVLRHVHHSKKSKSRDKIVPLHKVKHGNKKLSQKSQWWKVLQHHRRGNLPSKGRVKFGVGKKKLRLKALPTIK